MMATRKPPRQMAAKACERCRRRKIKCDEFFPCGQCTRMRVACKIEDPAEKRREQQQSAMEGRIKHLEALLIATFTNPNNQIDMSMPGLEQEGLLSSDISGGSPTTPGESSSQGMKLEPPRLTLQTPSSPEFRARESGELFSPAENLMGYQHWSPPPSITASAPVSATNYFPSDPPPWSTTGTTGGSGGSTPPANFPRPGRHTRTSSISTSDTSGQDEYIGSPTINGRNRFNIDTSGSTLDIPQIEVTSWDRSRPQTPAAFSPAMSTTSVMDMDTSQFYPPEFNMGSWSGLSSPSIVAPTYALEDNFLMVNQSLPSHSRRSSINSSTSELDAFLEPRRRRATSDVFPVPQQFLFPDDGTGDFFFDTTPRPMTPNFQQNQFSAEPQSFQQGPTISPSSQAKEDLYNRTFLEVVYPLFPILSPQNMPGNHIQNFSQSPTSDPYAFQQLSPEIAQTQALFIRAISAYVLSRRSSQATLPAQDYFNRGLRSHGAGKWDSLPGIQTGILLAIFILISGCQSPNLYICNSSIVAACIDLGLHKGGSIPGSLEMNTLISAYVLDRTVARVWDRPHLLKDQDLDQTVLGHLSSRLRGKAESGQVRRWPEGGRLWDWWILFEEGIRNGGLGGDVSAGIGGMEDSFGFGDM